MLQAIRIHYCHLQPYGQNNPKPRTGREIIMIFLNRSRLAEQAAHIFKYEACKLSLEKQNTNNFSVEKKKKKAKRHEKNKTEGKKLFF